MTINEAKKTVKKRYPFAVATNIDPFYGFAILIAAGQNMALVQNQRDEEAAWIAAAEALDRTPLPIEY